MLNAALSRLFFWQKHWGDELTHGVLLNLSNSSTTLFLNKGGSLVPSSNSMAAREVIKCTIDAALRVAGLESIAANAKFVTVRVRGAVPVCFDPANG